MIPITRPFLSEEEAEAVRKVILSGWVTQGPKVREFEKDFAAYVGAKHACAVSSCTTALHVALLTVGVKPGDIVITVSHSFIATANCIRYCGAEPIFIDIDQDSYNMSAENLAQFLEEECELRREKLFYKEASQEVRRVSALLVVHQMGMPCDLRTILPLAQKFNLPIIEDAACAIGSEIFLNNGESWEKIGKPHGDIACFSFHPRKVITTGEGGMLTTSNPDYDKRFRLLRHQGMSISDFKRHNTREIIFEEYPEVGYNYRMTDIQAAIGIEQLKRLPEIVMKRRRLAQLYQDKLSLISWIKVSKDSDNCRSNWQSFPIKILESAPVRRNALMQYLLDVNIATRPGIMNAHQEKAYETNSFSLKQSESARDRTILLPIFYDMKESEVDQIIRQIQNV